MNEFKYFEDICDQMDGVESIYDKYTLLILKDAFFSKFEDIPGYKINILGIPLYLLKKCKSKSFITKEDYREEFIRCVGPVKFQQEVDRFPDDFEKGFSIVQDFCDEAMKIYYSGFFGKLRALFRGQKNSGEYKKIE